MSDRVFVDSNVLIYAHDAAAGEKHRIAVKRIDDLWSTRLGVLSTQVLQEFYVNVTRKIPVPLSRSVARDVVRNYATWRVEQLGADEVLKASVLEEQAQLSFWDALIVVAAQQANAERILTEDLNPGQRIGGVLIENPFSPLKRA